MLQQRHDEGTTASRNVDQGQDVRGWQRDLPALVRACCIDWQLEPGEPYTTSDVGHATRVTLADGRPAVLKIARPHAEAAHEGDALALWNGDGAVQLYARDEQRWALLIERCDPGTPLSAAADPLGVLIGLLPRLWKPACAPFEVVTDWSETFRDEWETSGRPFDRILVEIGCALVHDLVRSQRERVLVNQDLHGGNVLASAREPWLVIDPKAVLAERELSAAPIVRSGEFGHSRAAVRYRLDRLTEELSLDRERAKAWTIAHTLAWAFDDDRAVAQEHLDVARWLLDP
jgi:streptomycin 6-kinase